MRTASRMSRPNVSRGPPTPDPNLLANTSRPASGSTHLMLRSH
jgi:hypothetical protein